MIPWIDLSLRWINRDGKLLIISRGISAFARSFITVFLALYLEKLGFSLIQIGVFLSVSGAGSAFFTFLVSLISERVGRRRLLVVFTLISATAGLALVFANNFLPLMFVAFLGRVTGREGGPIQPLEQASLSDTATAEKRTDLFAVYRIIVVGGTAFGALAAGLPTVFQNYFGMSEFDAYKVMFVGFACLLLVGALLYSLLSPAVEVGGNRRRWVNPLRLPSRRLIFTLAGLFSLDSVAGSLFLQSLAATCFFSRMDQPTHDSHTMSVLQPWERVAVASIHAIGRNIAGTFAPSIATALWQVFSVTVPLVSSAVLKITYDLSLYFMFRNVKPPQEANKKQEN